MIVEHSNEQSHMNLGQTHMPTSSPRVKPTLTNIIDEHAPPPLRNLTKSKQFVQKMLSYVVVILSYQQQMADDEQTLCTVNPSALGLVQIGCTLKKRDINDKGMIKDFTSLLAHNCLGLFKLPWHEFRATIDFASSLDRTPPPAFYQVFLTVHWHRDMWSLGGTSTVRVNCFVEHHNTVTPPKAQTWTILFRVQCARTKFFCPQLPGIIPN